jgi:hypothetical protein
MDEFHPPTCHIIEEGHGFFCLLLLYYNQWNIDMCHMGIRGLPSN